MLSTYLEWLDSLTDIDECTWDIPLTTGKWSMKAIILHMTNWDTYLIQETISLTAYKELAGDLYTAPGEPSDSDLIGGVCSR